VAIGWLGIRIVCPSGATYLPADKTALDGHWKRMESGE